MNSSSLQVDTVPAALAAIVGDVNVSANDLDRFVYSGGANVAMPPERVVGHFGSGALPACIVWPETTEQVAAIVRLANERGFPLVPWGGSVGFRGGSLPLSVDAVIVDTKKMAQVLAVNTEAMTVRVQAGAVRSDFDDQLAQLGYWLPFDPPSHPVSTIGGFISTAAAGWWMPKYGYIGDLLLALELVLPDGQVLQTKPVMKHSVGPNLNWLFVGAGGTLGIITEATLKIYPLPEARRTRIITFPTFTEAYRAAYAIHRAELNPYVIRVGDDGHCQVYLGRALMEPRLQGAALVVGFDGVDELVETQDRIALNIATQHGGYDWGLEMGQRFWDTRLNFWKQRKSTERTTNVITTAGSFDRIEALYAAIRGLYDRYGIHYSIHVNHLTAKGASLYCIFRHSVDEQGLALSRRVWQEAIPMLQALGGTLEHHHEIGVHLAPWVPAELGAGLGVLRRIKAALDPAGIMNPGKLALKPEERAGS